MKHEGRLLDEVVIEFLRDASQKRIESEIKMAQMDLAKYWNLKNPEFSYQYHKDERSARNSKLWMLANKGHSIIVK
jgi:hypothetical protein